MIIESFLGGFDKNFMYIIYDDSAKEAIIIDPFDTPRIIEFCKENDLKIKYLINTHSHFDHVYGNKELLEKTSAKLIDLDNNNPISMEGLEIQLISTPGHTDDSRCILVNNKIIVTGDLLFVNGIGFMKTFEGAKKMFNSLKTISKLPPEIVIYPGHNYGHSPTSTIGAELQSNPYLQNLDSEENFLKSINMSAS